MVTNQSSNLQFNGKKTSQFDELTKLGDDDLLIVDINGLSRTITYGNLREQIIQKLFSYSLKVGSMAFEDRTKYAKINHIHTGKYNKIEIGESHGQEIFRVNCIKTDETKTQTYIVSADSICGQIQEEPSIGTIKFVYDPYGKYENADGGDGWVNADGQSHNGIVVPNLSNFFKVSEDNNVISDQEPTVGLRNHNHPQKTINGMSLSLKSKAGGSGVIQTYGPPFVVGGPLRPSSGTVRLTDKEISLKINPSQMSIPEFDTELAGDDNQEPKPDHCLLRAMVYVGKGK